MSGAVKFVAPAVVTAGLTLVAGTALESAKHDPAKLDKNVIGLVGFGGVGLMAGGMVASLARGGAEAGALERMASNSAPVIASVGVGLLVTSMYFADRAHAAAMRDQGITVQR